jgi:hypothetical protein
MSATPTPTQGYQIRVPFTSAGAYDLELTKAAEWEVPHG